MLDIRDFDDMVDDTCQRIIDSDIGITNVSVGSVTRTLIEAIMAEIDVAQFTVYQAYISKTIDEAEGDDLDDVVSILSVTRNDATQCTGTVTFSVTEESDINIEIPSGSIVGTVQTTGGTLYEFETIDDAILPAGQMDCDVGVICTTPGYIYIPPNNVTVINDAIIGIAEVTNKDVITGGSDRETDEELRDRAKDSLSRFGKGTCDAIRVAVQDVEHVVDVNVYDMRSGVGTVDVFVITDVMPPTQEITDNINKAINESKAGGIRVYLQYPKIKYVDIELNIYSNIQYNADDISNSIIEYVNNLSIGSSLILRQLDRIILNLIDDDNADMEFIKPDENISSDVDEIIRPNSIKIGGVIYYERDNE